MRDMKYAQDRYVEGFVDKAKQKYLRDGKDFPSVVIAFHNQNAVVIPFRPRDHKHKAGLYSLLSVAFAAKGIKRFAVVADSWMAKTDLTDEEAASADRGFQAAVEKRQELPEYLENFPGRVEVLLWAVFNQNGQEVLMIQEHDSKERKFLKKARRLEDADNVMSAFREVVDRSKQLDLSGNPAGREKVWRGLLDLLRAEGTPAIEVSLMH